MDLILTLILFIITLSVFTYEISRKNKRNVFPFMTLVAIYYLFFYGISSIWTSLYQLHPIYPLELGGVTTVYIVAFICSQLIGYFLFSNLLFRFIDRSLFRRLQSPLNIGLHNFQTKPMLVLSSIAILAHFTFSAVPLLKEVPSINQLQQPLWYFGFGVLIWLSLGKKRPLKEIFIAGFAFLLCLVNFVLTGLTTPIFISLFIFLSAAFYWKRYFSTVATFIFLSVLFSSYSHVKYVANTYIKGGETGIRDFKPNISSYSIFASVNAAARRSSHGLVLEKVIQKTPREIPYAKYSPFFDAAINHIPRIIWRTKPEEVRGNWFGKRFSFVHQNDHRTSWNLPWTAEFYLIYGPIKAVTISFFIGGFISLFVIFLSLLRHRPIGFGIFSSSIIPLFYQESNFSLMFGNIITIALFLLISSYLFMLIYNFFLKSVEYR